MRFLLISDLHIGEGSRCKSLVPLEERAESKKHEQCYFERLEEISSDIEVDYVFVCGDIADRATYEQFTHFDSIIGQVTRLFDLEPSSIFFTLGNHDVDWSVLSTFENLPDDSNPRFRARYGAAEASQVIAGRLGEASFGTLLEAPYFCFWENEEVSVVSINTAASDGPWVSPHHGEVRREHYDALHTFLTQNDFGSKNTVKILLMHHHPIAYPNPSPDWKDFSILQCYDDLVELAHRHAFDFLFHGHRHHPNFKAEVSSEFGSQLNIVCRLLLSQKFPSYIYDNLSNMFHVVEVEDRAADTGVLVGSIRNFSFSKRDGWFKSRQPTCGIRGRLQFGPFSSKPALKNTLRELISQRLSTSQFCEMEGILNVNLDIKYQDSTLLMSVLNELATEESWRIIGDEFEKCVVLMHERGE